jgi:hypothetical protein
VDFTDFICVIFDHLLLNLLWNFVNLRKKLHFSGITRSSYMDGLLSSSSSSISSSILPSSVPSSTISSSVPSSVVLAS